LLTSNLSQNSQKSSIAYLSTYPPRECGIATFTKDLADSVEKLGKFKPPILIAINDKEKKYNYDKRVKWQIERNDINSYLKVAKEINSSDVDVVNLQHEFGLFGGDYGEYVLDFLDAIKKPVITTLHTVHEEFEPKAISTLKKIVLKSATVVVIAKIALAILEKQGIKLNQKVVIPHGCPQISNISSDTVKESLGLKNRFVLTTFGFLSKGKGIEYVIQALPKVIEKEPRLVYLVIGETHPQVIKQEGESYRNKLIKITETLGLEEYVQFKNRYLTKREIINFLKATDIYVTPYISANQISSGTLAYAMGAGKAIISTPYLYAQENLTGNRGVFSDFKNSNSISNCIEKLLDEDLRNEIAMKNYEYSKQFTWSTVASEYTKLFEKISKPKTVGKNKKEAGLSIEFATPY